MNRYTQHSQWFFTRKYMYQLIAMHIREISRPPVFIIVLDEHVSGDQRISQNPQPQGYTIDKEEEEGFEI